MSASLTLCLTTFFGTILSVPSAFAGDIGYTPPGRFLSELRRETCRRHDFNATLQRRFCIVVLFYRGRRDRMHGGGAGLRAELSGQGNPHHRRAERRRRHRFVRASARAED